MTSHNLIKNTLNILIPFLLGGAILWWMYRGFDFSAILNTEIEWGWMAFSMVFGVTAQLFRALRWHQSLEPLGEHPQMENCIHGVFLSYASSLIVPRSGEVLRCGVLNRYDGVNFAKSLGTVVAERAIDSVLLLLICLGVMMSQFGVFVDFFSATGTNLTTFLSRFTSTGYIVTVACVAITCVFVWLAVRKLTFVARVKQMVGHILEGIISFRNVRNKPLLLFYSLMIWVSYFLHYWLAFFCFHFTADLGLTVALVSFIVGSISVIVPTPNGAGPWHFSVKTILVLYGVLDADAITFVLIVHTVQTALIPLLGIFSLIRLSGKKAVSRI